MMILEFSY